MALLTDKIDRDKLSSIGLIRLTIPFFRKTIGGGRVMQQDIKRINRQMAITMLACSSIVTILLICKLVGMFDFPFELTLIVGIVGYITTLTPIIFYKLNVPDNFLRAYMAIWMSLFIGTVGCFNAIGIYITFVLVPVSSCLYFDRTYTRFCIIFSYLVMVAAVYINAAGKFEREIYGWSQETTFIKYIIGFTLEYVAVTLFLSQIMRHAKRLMEEQQEMHLKQKALDARYQLLIKETNEVVFEYYVKEDRYYANRSVFRPSDPIELKHFSENMAANGVFRKLYSKIAQGVADDRFEPFDIDMSYMEDGELIPLWYNVECFIVTQDDAVVSVIGKMHNITRVHELQKATRLKNLENISGEVKKSNTLFKQLMSECVDFGEAEYNNLADGHSIISKLMDDIKYSKDPEAGINDMLVKFGSIFNVDRISVLEIDMSSGTSAINYQWCREEKYNVTNTLTMMHPNDVKITMSAYDAKGYIEVNPSYNLFAAKANRDEAVAEVLDDIMLGNQLWIPMIENGEYMGAVCYDRVDTTPYTTVEKFLFADALNVLNAYVSKINADKANKAKTEFLSTMSHEIRTPMNAIMGMTEVALRENSNETVTQSLKMVQSSATSLLKLINDILDFSKIEAGRFEIIPESFYILSIANDVKQIVLARNAGKLNIEFEIPETIPSKMKADYDRLKQVMINYCSNAIKYSDAGTVSIRISATKYGINEAMLHFSVKDQGIGIKPEDLSKLFQTYSRVDTSLNHHKEGTGLGLAISKQLIEAMGGSVSVESEYGVGSTFAFNVPVFVEDWTPAGSFDNYRYVDETQGEEPTEEAFVAPWARVLVVDDTKMNLNVARALMRPTQMQIDLADCGFSALAKIQENDYDLIFMDHFMPEMDGVETTARIRALPDEKKSSTPIVALTADAVTGVREQLISKGMDDFLSKPILMPELLKILRKWIKPR